jgi:hypothetical protein
MHLSPAAIENAICLLESAAIRSGLGNMLATVDAPAG